MSEGGPPREVDADLGRLPDEDEIWQALKKMKDAKQHKEGSLMEGMGGYVPEGVRRAEDEAVRRAAAEEERRAAAERAAPGPPSLTPPPVALPSGGFYPF